MDRAPLPYTEDTNRVRSSANRDDLQDIAPSQVRAARGLLGWSAQRLAKLAKVDLGELIAFESDGYFLGALDFARVQRALIVGGVEFLPPTSRVGRGVQLPDLQPSESANRVRNPADRNSPRGIVPSQSRAARGLLGWTVKRLAKLADLKPDDLIAFESDGSRLGAFGVARAQRALIKGGVEFLPPTSRLLRGVQLAEPPRGGYIVFLGPPKPKRPWA